MPKLRFKGFTEDWDQRKLSDIVNLFGGNAFSSDDSINDGAKWLKIANVGIGHIRWNEKSFLPSSYLEDYPAYRLVPGDYVMALTRPILNGELKIAEITEENILLNQRVAKLIFECDKQFGYQLLRKNTTVNCIDNELAGTDPPNLSVSTMSNIKVRIPSENEQKIIGKYLKRLDNLINIHQRKCDELQKVKKYMLQKMFPKKGEKVPEIRFAGFTDDWEQRELGKYIVEYTEVTTENNQYPPLTSSRKGIFLQTEYFAGNQIASADTTGYNIVPYGYFTYRHMSDDEIFHFNINDIVENGIVSTLYPVFTTTQDLDSKYLQYQLNHGHEFAKYAVLQKQGGSRTYMYLNKLKKLHLTMPTEVEEQRKIASYFSKLDNLITLHQRKHETLKEIKKYMLQNMFPKK